MNWSNKTEVKKGNKGEKIIQEYLEQKQYNVYIPTTDIMHWFDGVATKNKEELFFYDVKTKPKFIYYEAQGIDERHYEQYLKLSEKTNSPFYIYFVDDQSGDVHKASLRKLQILKEKGEIIEFKNKKILAWYLKHLEFLFKLTDKQIKEFKDSGQKPNKRTLANGFSRF